MSCRAAGSDSPVDQGLDDAGVGEGGGVAEVVDVAFGDLAEDAAHDLAGAGLGQAGHHECALEGRDRAEALAHQGHQLGLELGGLALQRAAAATTPASPTRACMARAQPLTPS